MRLRVVVQLLTHPLDPNPGWIEWWQAPTPGRFWRIRARDTLAQVVGAKRW